MTGEPLTTAPWWQMLLDGALSEAEQRLEGGSRLTESDGDDPHSPTFFVFFDQAVPLARGQ